MLRVERILQFNITGLVILGALLLGISHGEYRLAIVATVVAIVSLYVTDILEVFYFNRLVANLAAVAAAAYSLNGFFTSESATQLFAIASLLIYLQMVLMFQQKSARVYWQLLVLSLLQVVVSAAVYVRVEAGLLFLLYLILALSAMALTYVYRENSLLKTLREKTEDELQNRKVDADGVKRSFQFRGLPLVTFASEYKERRAVTSLLSLALLIGCGAMVFATFYFYSIPRTREVWRGPESLRTSRVGFSRSIRFGEKGLIAPSDRVVFRATFIDPKTDKPMQLVDAPYFRGAVLNVYGRFDGRRDGEDSWDYHVSPGDSSGKLRSLPINRSGEKLPRLRINIDPNVDNTVFVAYPCRANEETPRDFLFDPQSYCVIREPTEGQKSFDRTTYEIDLMCLDGNRQLDMMPYTPPNSVSSNAPMRTSTQIMLTHYNQRQTYIHDLAHQLVRDLPKSDYRVVANHLAEYLRESGDFSYTLDYRTVERDTRLDPIEDFVKNYRRGHCEMFASALCMMLRHLGIPSRIVVGFRCGDYNELSQQYIVEDLHAHAWVEAYIPPGQVTREMIDRGMAGPGGAWLRLDPTPPSGYQGDDALFRRAGDALDLAQVFLDDFVINFNSTQQESDVYDKFMGDSSLIDRVVRSETWDRAVNEASDQMGIDRKQGRLIIQGLVVLAILVIGAIYWLWSIRRSARKERRKVPTFRQILGSVANLVSPQLGRWLSGVHEDGLQGQRVDFYEQLANILRRNGFERAAGESQAEFMRKILGDLQGDPRRDQLAPILPRIIDAFYLVRFGNRTLPSHQREEIQGWLRSLDRELQSGKLSPGKSVS